MVADNKPKGILLLTFGGPDSLEAIEPFMTNVMGARKPPAPLVAKMVERYKLIGGKSPLPEVSQEQASLLEASLNSGSDNYKVYVGMLHWHPFIKEAVVHMVEDGIQEVAALSLSPHFAQVTTGAYAKAIEAAASELKADIQVRFTQGFYDHPVFVAGLARRLQQALQEFPPEARSEVEVIFTAHSLPVAHMKSGDPYCEQLQASVDALVKKTGIAHWTLAYQSKGGGQGEWLGPGVEETMDRIAAQGKRYVLVSPVGFATDHIETLYDIDVAQKEHAKSLGLNFHRAVALNTAPEFIQVMAATIRSAF